MRGSWQQCSRNYGESTVCTAINARRLSRSAAPGGPIPQHVLTSPLCQIGGGWLHYPALKTFISTYVQSLI